MSRPWRPRWHYPEGKGAYCCPGCGKVMEQQDLYEVVVMRDKIHMFHKGCYKPAAKTREQGIRECLGLLGERAP